MADPCFRSEAPTGSTSSKSCLIVMRVKRREKAEGGASIDTNESCQTKNCCPRSSCCVPWRFAISSWDRTCHDQRTCSVFSGFRPPFRSNSKAQSGRRPEATPESPRPWHKSYIIWGCNLVHAPRLQKQILSLVSHRTFCNSKASRLVPQLLTQSHGLQGLVFTTCTAQTISRENCPQFLGDKLLQIPTLNSEPNDGIRSLTAAGLELEAPSQGSTAVLAGSVY